MKTVIFSFAVVALMKISSVATAQCSSCGQQAIAQPTFNQNIVTEAAYVQPVTFNQPIVTETAFAQPATTGCSSCGTAAVASYAAPIETSYAPVSTGCSSCGQAPAYVAPAASACCCTGQSSRGGLLRGARNNGVSSRLIRGGLFSTIRDN